MVVTKCRKKLIRIRDNDNINKLYILSNPMNHRDGNKPSIAK